MSDSDAVRDVLSKAGITIGKHDRLEPFSREGNSVFDHVPDRPDMFILQVSAHNSAYGDCESILNKSGLTIHSYGSFVFGDRIAVISLDIPVEEAGVFSMETWLKAIHLVPHHAIAVRMQIDSARVYCEHYRTIDENAWACHRALRAILNDDSLSDADLNAHGLMIHTYRVS